MKTHENQALYPDHVGDDEPETAVDERSALAAGTFEPGSFGSELFSLLPTPATSRGRDHPGIVRAIEIIREEYSQPLTVALLARECGMSVRSLQRLYRRVTGTTIGRALVVRRLEAAAQMLREDDVKLEPVAMETGLRNARNLCRVFKDHLGITPGQWKESHHKQNKPTL